MMAVDRVVLVTGAAGRLGAAIVRTLAERGARLVLVDRVAPPVPEGAHAVVLEQDVTAAGSSEAAVGHALERFGRLDALVNNAGIEGPVARAEDVALDEVRRLFEVNVLATLAFSAAAMRQFRAVGTGRIVNLASGAGLAGSAMMAPYSASKHAVVGLTRSMAAEAGAAGVAVNAVCPGCVDSPMMDRIEARLGELAGTGPASFTGSIPMGRYADPREVAQAVAWLALEAPVYITGSAIVIDGGLRA
ncbi:MAG: SDR family oxidoreductase [Thermoleophilia bacterium]|nr:SDR family oxidoreductase [Thermoleophilia bacterium]